MGAFSTREDHPDELDGQPDHDAAQAPVPRMTHDRTYAATARLRPADAQPAEPPASPDDTALAHDDLPGAPPPQHSQQQTRVWPPPDMSTHPSTILLWDSHPLFGPHSLSAQCHVDWLIRPSEVLRVRRFLVEATLLPPELVDLIARFAGWMTASVRVFMEGDASFGSDADVPYFISRDLTRLPVPSGWGYEQEGGGKRRFLLKGVKCVSLSHDQGWSSYPAEHGTQTSWAFHELGIASSSHPSRITEIIKLAEDIPAELPPEIRFQRALMMRNYHAVGEYRRIEREVRIPPDLARFLLASPGSPDENDAVPYLEKCTDADKATIKALLNVILLGGSDREEGKKEDGKKKKEEEEEEEEKRALFPGWVHHIRYAHIDLTLGMITS
jgi:hypothetical protein